MSTSVTTAFVTEFDSELNLAFQREGGMLLPTVTHRRNVVGSTYTFEHVGTGAAVTKSRHGTITPMSLTYTAPTATIADFYAGDWHDKLDASKAKIDVNKGIALTGAQALGRKVDTQLLTAMTATTQASVTLTLTTIGLARSGLLSWVKELVGNDVPNDGRLFGTLSPTLWAIAETIPQFASLDYVGPNGMPYPSGAPGFRQFRKWNGVLWCVHTGLTNIGAASCEGFVYHQRAIGYASGKLDGNVADGQMAKADITWHGDRAAWFVNNMMSGGAALIDDSGVIQGTWDDSSAVPTA